MPFYKPYRALNKRCEIVLHHVWNLLNQCYITVGEKQSLYISNIIAALQILIFNIKVLQRQIMSFCEWPQLYKKQLEKHMHRFEKCQLKFQIATSAKEHVPKLKRHKIVELCQHIRWSIKEAQFLSSVCNSSTNYTIKLYKWRKFVLTNLVKSNGEKHWIKDYLFIVSKFKKIADKVSEAIDVYHQYRSHQEHQALLEDFKKIIN
jgi:hypothetical protein